MAESKELLDGLYVQDQYEINGDQETMVTPLDSCDYSKV
ncbi:hypothetical protein P5673_009259 [Acropora cervicornis]|uniref:Uncharacterized protein n=1 Tax=Acropora cervicornis TaxID=6130 RepID=A0AAD9QS98_ACRCE|nr:hypothetical protein P5673_009259 [Acropora cervicornis]